MRNRLSYIEVIIVVAIAACLVAFLAPVFATTQTQAGIEQCQARGKKLGVAMLAYMSDNDGKYPCQATPAQLGKIGNVTWKYDWPGYHDKPGYVPPAIGGVSDMNQFAYIQLAKYVKNKDTWICPLPGGVYGLKYSGLFRNSWLFRGGGSQYDAGFWHSAKMPDGYYRSIGRTISQVLTLDAGGKNEDGYVEVYHPRHMTPGTKIFAFCISVGDAYCVGAWEGGPCINPGGYYAHGEGTVYLYADGHVAWREMGHGMNPVHYTNDPIDEPHQHK